MKNLLIAATVLLAGTAALAQGQQAPQGQPVAQPAPGPAHDHPMVTSRADMVAMARAHFARLDANKDGAITKDEMKMLGEHRGKRFERRHGEGPAGMGAAGHDLNAAFDRLDSNKDGVISREEFGQAREKRIERRMVRRQEMKDGDQHGAMMGLHRGMGGPMILMADSDKDGKITLAEVEAMALKHFDAMDKNHDGQLSPDERGAGMKMMMMHQVEVK